MEILAHCRIRLVPGVSCRAAALGLTLALAGGVAAGTQEQPLDEYQVKAAFIYNFAKFVTWPQESFASATDPINICIFGQNPFGHWLYDTISGRAIEGRGLTVRNIAAPGEASSCHILFVDTAQDKRSLAALRESKLAGILTIGESSAAENAGVIVDFRLDGGRIRFDINLQAALQEKLQISSRLLNLARIVKK
jgi:YfiR/HmsC-like